MAHDPCAGCQTCLSNVIDLDEIECPPVCDEYPECNEVDACTWPNCGVP